MGEIRAASSEQSSGVAQVSDAVVQMDQATQQNSALVEEMSAAASSLESQAQDLVELVAVFKLDAGEMGHGASSRRVNSPLQATKLNASTKRQTPSRDAMVTALAPYALPRNQI
jgi:methyl-accepting chemotaxis protein